MGLNDALYRYLAEVNLQQLVNNQGKTNTEAVSVTLSKRATKAEPAPA
jgi:hypothetical protein